MRSGSNSRVALLTTNYSKSTIEELLTWVPHRLGDKFVRIQLYCEDKKLPHPVKNQHGITLTSLSESQSECLDKALPYINIFFYVLTRAIRLDINSVAPLASSVLSNDWTPHLKLVKEHSMISSTIKSELDRSTS